MEFNQLLLVQNQVLQLRQTFMVLLTSALKAFQIIEINRDSHRSIEMKEKCPWILISLILSSMTSIEKSLQDREKVHQIMVKTTIKSWPQDHLTLLLMADGRQVQSPQLKLKKVHHLLVITTISI